MAAVARGPATAMAPAAGSGATAAAEEMRWRQLDSGVSAVSFGFVATAILVSMFLAMAILEHFLRPPAHAPGHAPPRGILRRLRLFLGRGGERGAAPGADLEAARKLQGHAPPRDTCLPQRRLSSDARARHANVHRASCPCSLPPREDPMAITPVPSFHWFLVQP